jgi:hypothetical protein
MPKTQGRRRAPDPKRAMLRHTVATVAYRGGKTLRGAPPGFAAFRAGEASRSAGELLAHVGDLFDWALSIAKGRETWHNSKPLSWDQEVERFFAALAAFDACLGSGEPLHGDLEKLFQGPVADALTHVGQIAMLRRLAGSPVRGENYFRADIAGGRVGPDQSRPKREFD